MISRDKRTMAVTDKHSTCSDYNWYNGRNL